MQNNKHILAIGLSERLIAALRVQHEQSRFVEGSLAKVEDMIDEISFDTVLLDLCLSDKPYDDIVNLLSLTPITTRVVSISPRWTYQDAKLKSLGVPNFISPVSVEQLSPYCR